MADKALISWAIEGAFGYDAGVHTRASNTQLKPFCTGKADNSVGIAVVAVRRTGFLSCSSD